MLNTAMLPERSSFDKLEVDDNKGDDGIDGSSNKPPHY